MDETPKTDGVLRDPGRQPMSGARGFVIAVGAMFGIIGVLWLIGWYLA